MAKYRARSGFYEIDGRNVWFDSKTEFLTVQNLIDKGFSGKWSRPRDGRSLHSTRYTPDLTLDIMWNGYPKTVFVEVKHTSAGEFTKKRREAAMVACGCIRGSNTLLLYVKKTGKWYEVMRNLLLRKIPEPVPATSEPKPIKAPFHITLKNRYGRSYDQEIGRTVTLKIINALENSIRSLFGGSRR